MREPDPDGQLTEGSADGELVGLRMASRPVDVEAVWFVRWFEQLPGPSWLSLVVTTGAGMVAFLLIPTSGGGLVHVRRSVELWTPFLSLYLVTVHSIALPLLLRRAQGAFGQLRPRMRAAPEDLETRYWRLSHYEGSGYLVASCVLVALWFGLQEVGSQRWSRLLAGDWQAFDLVSPPVILAGWLAMGQAIFLLVHIARQLGDSAREVWFPPLFDTRCGLPLVRFGLGAVVLLTTLNSGVAMLCTRFVEESALMGWGSVLVVFAVNAGEAALVLFFPLLIWHRKIRDMKESELTRVHAELERERETLSGSQRTSRAEESHLLTLLTYRREVERLTTMPFTASNVRSLVLYLLLPPLSWIAAAIMEHVVDRVL